MKTIGDIKECTSYHYDRNGNQLVKEREAIAPAGTSGESVMGFHVDEVCIELREYDGFGQLSRVYTDGKTAIYRYKPDGLRYQKIVDGIAQTQIWDGNEIIAEINSEDEIVAKYLRGINLIAREGVNRQFYLFNAHGDVVQLRDANSGELWYYTSDAFGNERSIAGQNRERDSNPFRYCGEFFDKETNTIYLRARYYRPQIGRFVSEDSFTQNTLRLANGQEIVDPLSLNRYTYGYNNPITYMDASGHVAIEAAAIVGIAFAFLALVAATAITAELIKNGATVSPPSMPTGQGLAELGLKLAIYNTTGLLLFTQYVDNVKTKTENKTNEERHKKIKGKFQLAFIDPITGNLKKVGSKLDSKIALFILETGRLVESHLSLMIDAYCDIYNIDTSSISEKRRGEILYDMRWGVYAESQFDAKIMAEILGLDRNYSEPHYHGYGYYAHYNTTKTVRESGIHVWFGDKMYKD